VARMQAAVRGEVIPDDPPASAQWGTVITHYRASLSHYGSELGRRVVRKHLGWYADSAGLARPARDALIRAENAEPLLMQLASGARAEAA